MMKVVLEDLKLSHILVVSYFIVERVACSCCIFIYFLAQAEMEIKTIYLKKNHFILFASNLCIN